MAEILIKLQRADDETDKKAFTRGHPVVVQPDGWEWGALERPPRFFVLAVSGLTVEQARPYLEPDLDVAVGDAPPAYLAVRKWWLDIDAADLPVAIKNSIRDTGRASVTKAQLEAFIKRTI